MLFAMLRIEYFLFLKIAISRRSALVMSPFMVLSLTYLSVLIDCGIDNSNQPYR